MTMAVEEPAQKTIAVFGGDADQLKRVREILERRSYRVAEAVDLHDADGIATSSRIDLFLLLASRLEHEAPAFIQRLRASSDAPILAVVSDDIALIAPLADDVLRAGFSEPELVARCRVLLALKSAGDELNALKRVVEGRVAERTEVLELALRGQGDMLSEAREARRIWEATFNSITDAIAITDVHGRIAQVSEHASDVFARRPEELIGEGCAQLMASGCCPHEEALLKQNLVEREELSLEGRLLNIRVSSFADPEGHTAGFVHVYRDVTEQRALERQLMHVERMTLAGKLVSAVAHEVATPLSVIANIAEMLLLDVEPGSPTAQELRKITTQARRITEMMRGLLNFVRQAPSEFTAVDLAQLVRETVELMSYELRRRQIEFSVESDPSTPAVAGDRVQLQQVALNLLTNAMQAMKDGGRLWIRLNPVSHGVSDKGSVALVVEDTGPGVTEDALPRLFDYFFTTRVAEGGAGLGLAITKQIVEGHGGRIIAGNADGGGARFVVTLPAVLPKERPAARSAFERQILSEYEGCEERRTQDTDR